MTKKTAETTANQQLEVAKLEHSAATENAAKVVELAKAEKERIALGGAITEEKKVLATIQADRDVRVAEALAKVNVPQFTITGGAGANGQVADTQSQLMNIVLMKQLGIIPNTPVVAPKAN